MSAGRRWLTSSSRSGGTSCPASALLQLKGGSRSCSRLSRPAHPPSRPRGRGKRGGERGRGVPLTTLLDFLAGFTGDYAPRVMFPSGVARPKMLRILAGMYQKDCCSGICKAGFPGVAPRAVLWGMAFWKNFHTFLRVRHDALHTVSLFDMWSMSLLCGSCSFHRCFSLVSTLAQSRRLPGP